MQPAVPGAAVARPADPQDVQPADPRPAISWARQHWVLTLGLALIAVEVLWKANFLSHLYFRQDDFHDLDLAVGAPLSWRYLTFIGAGHLIIGLRLVAWVLVRVSLYNWALASAVSLFFVAAANLAALRLFRLLFGERPAILIPLLIYAICPLTLPDLGEWSSALESVPLQLAIFMALYSHIRYVRTGRTRPLVFAAGWIGFGLLFFEKGLVLPVLLFAITVGFLSSAPSLPLALRQAAVRYWRAWATYAAMMAGYLVLLTIALHTSTTHPGAPSSAAQVATFSSGLLKSSLLPGMIGGPWQWLPVPGGSYSFSAVAPSLAWLSVLAVAAIIVVSVRMRRAAWRAWAILAIWVVSADMVPVIISRLGAFSAGVLGTETRYLADGIPVVAICIGLAFWPLAQGLVAGPSPAEIAPAPAAPAEAAPAEAAPAGTRPTAGYQLSGSLAATMVAIFVFGSIWSVQAYENVTTGAPAATYISNARQAIELVPRGTPVMNVDVPGNMVEGLFGTYAQESTVIGDLAPDKLAWTKHPKGTIVALRIFGGNGKLYQALVYGASSPPLTPGEKCWPDHKGKVVVELRKPSPTYTGMLRLGYLWYSHGPGVISVRFGPQQRLLRVLPGLHAGYVPVTGSASRVRVNLLNASGLCIGDAEAGNLSPNPLGQVLPPALRGAA